jgi:hypothetical protein
MATHDVKPSSVTVSSSPQVGDLTPEGRKKRYNELRARLGKSRLEVKGKPGIHYFWADKGDGNELSRLDVMGYKITREPNAKEVLAGNASPEIQANGLREDGTYTLGDVILTECPEEVYEFLQLDVTERHEALVGGAAEEFISEAAKKGVPTFPVDKP